MPILHSHKFSYFSLLYCFYSPVTFIVNSAFTPSPNLISAVYLPRDFIVSFNVIFFLSISNLCCFFNSSAISFDVIPPNILLFSPTFAFIVSSIFSIFLAISLFASISAFF